MSSSTAIEIVIGGDAYNAPEIKEIETTIVVKVPPNANLQTVNEKIMERYPVLRDSLNMYYFVDKNGKYHPP